MISVVQLDVVDYATSLQLQQRLVTAGYRNREAIVLFFGIRLVVAIGVFLVCATILGQNLIVCLGVCGVSYLVPSFVLTRRIGCPGKLNTCVGHRSVWRRTISTAPTFNATAMAFRAFDCSDECTLAFVPDITAATVNR